MMRWFRIASFAFSIILFGQDVMGEVKFRDGVYISWPATEEPVTVTSYVIIYDGTLTGTTTSDYESTTATSTAVSTIDTSEAETLISSSAASVSSSALAGPTAFFTLPIIRVTISPAAPALSASSTLSTFFTVSTSSTSTAPDANQTDYHTPSSAQQAQSTHITAAQIAGIAIGSGVFFCLVAALFFFCGRRNGGRSAGNGERRLCMRDVSGGLGTAWRRGKGDARQQKRIDVIQGPVELPAEPAVELPAGFGDVVGSCGVKGGVGEMERRVDGVPFGFEAPVVKELDGASVVSYKPMSPSPAQQEQQQHHPGPQQQTQEAEISLVPETPGENGGSTLPRYEELDGEARARLFSWAAPESAYRPDKSWYEE